MWYNIINKRSQTAAYFNIKENNVSLKNLGDVTYFRLNNEINRPVNNQIPLHKDKEALDAFFKENVEPNYVKFNSFKERLDYLIEHDYIDTTMTDKYSVEFMEELHNWLYAQNFQFKSFMAAYKFYQQYALKTNDNEYYLENVEDRIWNNALYFADGNEQLAKDLAEELVNQRYQPATPSYLSAGRSRRGELISCFPAGTKITLEGGLSKNIEEIQVGDKVLTHTGSVKPVTELIVTPNNKEKMYVIKPANSPAVTLTANHPVLVYSDEPNENIQSVFNNGLPSPKHKWVRADQIRPKQDYVLLTSEDTWVPVLDVTQTDDANTVYNLEVEDDHSYTAEGIAVHNCFLIDISQDSMNSIGRSINSALQLSRIGGGVGLNLSNLREAGAPIKGIQNAASGVVPVMKLLEDSFSYSNQLGQRQGAGAVYLSVHHPDIMSFLSTKKENADEKIRVKTLSLGLVVTDRFYEAARKNEPLYQFSPYDVEREYGKAFSYIDINAEYDNMVNNPRITKTSVNARVLEEEISKLQQESGYPYIMNVDVVNRANPAGGRVIMSNLC